jgi:hypothetical protein
MKEIDRTEEILTKFRKILKDTPKEKMDEIIAKIDAIGDTNISAIDYFNLIGTENINN